jgi:hypothetical protein
LNVPIALSALADGTSGTLGLTLALAVR